MTPEEAIEVIAREVIQTQNDPDQIVDRWEDHPLLGEDDWNLVVEKVAELTPTVGVGEYEEAYALLSARAQHEEADDA